MQVLISVGETRSGKRFITYGVLLLSDHSLVKAQISGSIVAPFQLRKRAGAWPTQPGDQKCGSRRKLSLESRQRDGKSLTFWYLCS